jgi:hypothetical protein
VATKLPDIPPSLRDLYSASGPVIRFRLVRDIIGQDDTYITTAHLGLDIPRLPEVQALFTAQEIDGSWAGVLAGAPDDAAAVTTERAVLRLCELGLEKCEAVNQCIEKALLPTLIQSDVLWEFQDWAETDDAARHIVRDKTLRLICRATREYDDLIRPLMQLVLTEWEFFLSNPQTAGVRPPTADAYFAVCWFPWSDDDFERVRPLVKRLSEYAEGRIGGEMALPDVYAPYVYQLADKWEYMARPQDLFYELELAARLGVARDLSVTQWLLEELEARQDTDGMFRFDVGGDVEASWYFPLEKTRIEEFPVEWTFRAELIYKLLEFDIE